MEFSNVWYKYNKTDNWMSNYTIANLFACVTNLFENASKQMLQQIY